MASMTCKTQQGVRSPSLCNERRNPHALPRPHIFTNAPFTRGGGGMRAVMSLTEYFYCNITEYGCKYTNIFNKTNYFSDFITYKVWECRSRSFQRFGRWRQTC